MPRKPRQFVTGEIYHIVLRRIENEPFFVNIDDYYRGIFSIYEFNTTTPVRIYDRRRKIEAAKRRFREQLQNGQFKQGLTSRKVGVAQKPVAVIVTDKRDLLVEILAFCLMPNHLHLLVRQLKEGGISKFMQKLGSGYASYFKKKYGLKLRGHFFQDRFEAVHIKTDIQLRVVFVYIHTNPISLIEPKWKEKGIANPKKVIKFVENYKWSSYPDYIGKKNFPSLTERKFMLKVMKGEKGCREWVESWIKYKGEIKKLMEKYSELALE